MGLFNWGALPKAQDNAQTIDEAIIAAIVAHESDPTAHLGDGESLQQHKNNEVIDHPAFSIVPDKTSQVDKPFYTYFENPTFLETSGHASGSLLYYKVSSLGNDIYDSYAYANNFYFANDSNDDPLDNFLDYNFRIYSNYNTATIYFGMEVYDYLPEYGNFLGIKIVNKVVYFGFANESYIVWTSGPTLVDYQKHVVRFATNSTTKSAEIWLDGLLMKSYSLGNSSAWTVNSFGIYLNKIGGTLNSQHTDIISRYIIFSNPAF